MACPGGRDDGRRRILSSGVFFAEGAEPCLMESMGGGIRPRREEEDRFSALISLRAGFSPAPFLFFAL